MMWKRDNPQETPTPTTTTPPAERSERAGEIKTLANIGKSVIIKGELNGSEDLTVEGHVDGKIDLRDHVLTIGPNGRIQAQVFARAVVIHGQVIGNIIATERVTIRENGAVEGDIQAPRFAIAEGAKFRGKVDMQGEPVTPGKAKANAKNESSPASSQPSGKPAEA